MQRLTISIDDELAEAFDALVAARGYANRSEAVRDLVRRELGEHQLHTDPRAPCVAVLSYVFDHHERQLAGRLAAHQHAHHELTVATLHAHLDAALCIETALLRGPKAQVQALADSVVAQTGVQHGHVHLVPVALPDPVRWRRR